VRAIGLDIGEKSVGVALSDELGIAGHPLTTLRRRGSRHDAVDIASLVETHSVTDVVVGWPLDLAGRQGPATRRVNSLVEALGPLLPPGTRLHKWDERFSTKAVERVLIEADLSRKRRKQVVDRQAAVFILQGWLDAYRTNQ
jgi:putative Holliday junction resolvase